MVDDRKKLRMDFADPQNRLSEGLVNQNGELMLCINVF